MSLFFLGNELQIFEEIADSILLGRDVCSIPLSELTEKCEFSIKKTMFGEKKNIISSRRSKYYSKDYVDTNRQKAENDYKERLAIIQKASSYLKFNYEVSTTKHIKKIYQTEPNKHGYYSMAENHIYTTSAVISIPKYQFINIYYERFINAGEEFRVRIECNPIAKECVDRLIHILSSKELYNIVSLSISSLRIYIKESWDDGWNLEYKSFGYKNLSQLAEIYGLFLEIIRELTNEVKEIRWLPISISPTECKFRVMLTKKDKTIDLKNW